MKRNEINKLVKNIFDDRVPEKFINLIYRKSEGNPLYTEEILKSLLVENLISMDDREWYQTIDYSKIEIPDSINEVVMMRLDRVTMGSKVIDQILKYTSIIGSTFNFNILLSAMQLDEEMLLDHLEKLMSANIIYEINVDEYKFDHTLIREVIYKNLGARRKKIMHAKIGHCIESMFKNSLNEHYVKLAYHFSKGGVIDKAVFYSMKEGEVAKELWAYDEAIFHNRSALEMLKGDTEFTIAQDKLINLHIDLGDLSMILGVWNDAKNYFERAFEISKEFGDDQKRVESSSKLGEIEEKREKWSLAVQKMEEVLDLKLDEKKTNVLLVTINPKYVIRANISLINILLKENLKGIYICINHPSYLVDKLLRTHQIPTQNLSYLDFITPISGILQDAGENVHGIDNAFSLDSLLDAMNIESEQFFEQSDFDLNNIDFIMVDNISNLITFATQEKIKQFTENLINIIRKTTLVYGIIFLESKSEPEVQKSIESYFDKVVTIKEEWL
jgi:tetratricopeptide (TPR) repeat protein